MSEREASVFQRLADVLPKLSEKSTEYLRGVGDGIMLASRSDETEGGSDDG